MTKITDETDLWDAMLLLDTREEVINFMKDLCTPREITELYERWKVCQLLESGQLSYREISTKTKISITTIGRVARFLRDEQNGGYRTILKKLKK
ncbi:MAG: hypothetical protein LBR91_02890 [Puniceicoccales bacterium]|jgi:TrpR-related protein YerC/YecD|nr:hypothetical protein [Puniceicoccales bacterium]